MSKENQFWHQQYQRTAFPSEVAGRTADKQDDNNGIYQSKGKALACNTQMAIAQIVEGNSVKTTTERAIKM